MFWTRKTIDFLFLEKHTEKLGKALSFLLTNTLNLKITLKALEWIFAPGSLAEVPISAPFGTYRLSGKIDRLIVEKDHVWAIDFKTNATVPKQAADCPLGILRQLAAYAHALKQIYPDKHIKLGILWTHSCSFMAVEHEIVTNALRDTPYLDAGTPAS